MDVCLCAGSAIEFWRAIRLQGPSALARMRLQHDAAASSLPDWRKAGSIKRLPVFQAPSHAWLAATLLNDGSPLSGPIDLLVSTGESRGYSLSAVGHRVPSDLLLQEVVRVNEHVYVTSPARSLFDVERGLSRCEFLRLASEFCGSYAIDAGGQRGFQTVPPLLQVADIIETCRPRIKTRAGIRLMRGLSFALDGCASPAEASMALLLCLPFRDGGYSLPLPKMNETVVPTAYVKPLMDRNHYVGDAVWRDRRVIVEYDSRTEHSRGLSVAHDNVRKLALESMGYHVVSVTNVMLADKGLFEKVALDVAKRLGRRVDRNRRAENWDELHAHAREVLINTPANWWRQMSCPDNVG